VTIKNVTADGPSDGTLKPGDVITKVDGQPVTSAPKLTELVRARPAGTALSIEYKRGSATATTKVTTRAADGEPPRIGVEIESKQPHPFELKIDLAEIGGPSAGLMFALGIIDKIEPDDLTGGRIIAGTGTIDDEGNVGPIGGIAQKLVGAKEAGAVYFLTPADNCAEAKANARKGLPLIKVGTLDEAFTALETLRENGQPTLC
jgi:PDZ domain-containing protein